MQEMPRQLLREAGVLTASAQASTLREKFPDATALMKLLGKSCKHVAANAMDGITAGILIYKLLQDQGGRAVVHEDGYVLSSSDDSVVEVVWRLGGYRLLLDPGSEDSCDRANPSDCGTPDPGARTSGTSDPGAHAPGARAPGTRAPGARAPGARAPGACAESTSNPGAQPESDEFNMEPETIFTQNPGLDTVTGDLLFKDVVKCETLVLVYNKFRDAIDKALERDLSELEQEDISDGEVEKPMQAINKIFFSADGVPAQSFLSLMEQGTIDGRVHCSHGGYHGCKEVLYMIVRHYQAAIFDPILDTYRKSSGMQHWFKCASDDRQTVAECRQIYWASIWCACEEFVNVNGREPTTEELDDYMLERAGLCPLANCLLSMQRMLDVVWLC
jgi:hypothetical protein